MTTKNSTTKKNSAASDVITASYAIGWLIEAWGAKVGSNPKAIKEISDNFGYLLFLACQVKNPPTFAEFRRHERRRQRARQTGAA